MSLNRDGNKEEEQRRERREKGEFEECTEKTRTEKQNLQSSECLAVFTVNLYSVKEF